MTSKHPHSGRPNSLERSPRMFRVQRRGYAIIELPLRTVAAERSLQRLIERHLLALLDIRPVASEYPIGAKRHGRIDTLGLDRQGSPVVVEYKRKLSVNIISQGLFYLDWLDEHRGDFRVLVHERIGDGAAAAIRWDAPRLVCVAADYHRYDLRAVRQIDRHIELFRYAWFGEDLLLLTFIDARSPH